MMEKGKATKEEIAEFLSGYYPPSEQNIPKGVRTGAPRKMQRNDSCYCGSGKKLKKCCINKKTR